MGCMYAIGYFYYPWSQEGEKVGQEMENMETQTESMKQEVIGESETASTSSREELKNQVSEILSVKAEEAKSEAREEASASPAAASADSVSPEEPANPTDVVGKQFFYFFNL